MSLSTNTVQAYESAVKRLVRLADTVNLYDYKKMISTIDALTIGDSGKKMYYVALHHYTKDKPDINNLYRDKFMKITKDLSVKSLEQKKTPAEEEKWMEWPELQKVGLSIMNDETLDLETRILAGLCTQIPPARLDYTNLPIYTGSPPEMHEDNYILVTLNGTMKMEVVIDEHKTAKKFGTLRRILPRPLVSIVHKWMITNGSERKLFQGITPNALGKRITAMFQKHTDKPINNNILRHSYITYEKDGEMSIKAKNTLSVTMGHSVTMSDLYRRI